MDHAGLFVDDDEIMEDAGNQPEVQSGLLSQTASGFELDESENGEEDDPIVESIPVIMNDIPDLNQHVYVLQYPGRPKSSPVEEERISASIKPESRYLEVKVPIVTEKFYDENRAEEWGVQVTEHSLQGVLDKTRGGLYVGKIRQIDGQRQVVLVPVDRSAQLRPSFKYVDDAETARTNQRKADMGDHIPKQTSSHVLQTSARTGIQPDGFSTTMLGESLKHIRQFEDEEWSHLQYHGPNDAPSAELNQHLIGDADAQPLSTTTQLSDYILQLTR